VIEIRRIRLGEGALFREIRLAALLDSPAAFGSTYEGALERSGESWSAQADSTATGDQRCTYLAFAGGLPVGITALYRDATEPSRGELIQVWVAPTHRRQGLAAELMSVALSWAGAHGVATVLAGVAQTNLPVIAFYEKHGFVKPPNGDETATLYLERHL